MSLTFQTLLCRNAEILHTMVGSDELVMFDKDAGKYYGLNATAARVWELLAHPMTVQELSRQIHMEFDVDLETCEPVILALADTMIDKGMVVAVQA